MARKGVKKQFWLSQEQAYDLAHKAALACLDEVAVIRMLLAGYYPPEAPGEAFHEDMESLLRASDDLHALADRCKDSEGKKMLMETVADMRELRMDLRRKYLIGEREEAKWQ